MTTRTTSRSGLLKMWVLNLAANAAVLLAWYWWLLIPDSHAWQVAGSLLLALVVVVLAVWLRAGTLAYFRISELRAANDIWPAFRRSARHIPALAVWAGLGVAVLWIILSAGNYTPQFSVWIRQKINAGQPPRNFWRDTDWLFFLLMWVVFPAIWLPVASAIAAFGLRLSMIGRSLRVLRRFRYWLALCVLMGIGAYLPYKLITWVPGMKGLQPQAWSAGLRFTFAYLIAITAFVLLVWMVGVYCEIETPADDPA